MLMFIGLPPTLDLFCVWTSDCGNVSTKLFFSFTTVYILAQYFPSAHTKDLSSLLKYVYIFESSVFTKPYPLMLSLVFP